MPAKEDKYAHLKKVSMPWQKIGAKQISIAMLWIPNAVTFSIAGALAGLYFTDWRLITNYIPYYNGKYPKEEDE